MLLLWRNFLQRVRVSQDVAPQPPAFIMTPLVAILQYHLGKYVLGAQPVSHPGSQQ